MNRRVFLSLLAALPFVGRWFHSEAVEELPYNILEFPAESWPQGAGTFEYDYWSPLLTNRVFSDGFWLDCHPIVSSLLQGIPQHLQEDINESQLGDAGTSGAGRP